MAHWSEKTMRSCGAIFRIGSSAEARHRHNYPLMCRQKKKASAQPRSGSKRDGAPAQVRRTASEGSQ